MQVTWSPRSGRARSVRPAVESLEGRTIPAIVTVTGTGDMVAFDGPVTLREAITAINTGADISDVTHTGTYGVNDTIKFNITGQTLHTIKPTTALPTITKKVTIDGFSQPGTSANTLAIGNNAKLFIELDGTNAGNATGLEIKASNCAVQGLVINSFQGDGIDLIGATGAVVAGNFIGTDATGKIDRGNGNNGVIIEGTSNAQIGSANPADRNVISGNQNRGVLFYIGSPANNKVQGNYIGTDASGLAALGNAADGITFFDGDNNLIGGPLPGQGNVVSANGTDPGFWSGIVVASQSSTKNVIQGNWIGLAVNGAPRGNSHYGIDLFAGSDTLVAGNQIAFNGQAGVKVGDLARGISIQGNSIHDNKGLGIDLEDGSNANNGQVTPSLALAYVTGGTTTVQGVSQGAANQTFRLEFFANVAADPSGFGEGQTFLGALNVTTDAQGHASFTAVLPGVPPGQFVSATATDTKGNTSEFSTVVPVVQAFTGDVTAQASVRRGKPRKRADGTYRQKVTLTNVGNGILQGPVYLVLDGLTRKVKLKKRNGVTKSQAPAGSSYRSIDLGTGGMLQPGESRTFVLVFANPLARKVRYTPRVLAGTGPL